MIRKFDLEHTRLAMGAMGLLRYMDFLLPCCRSCNCNLLGPIERSVKRALESERLHAVARYKLAAWACKIILGFQLYDRAERDDRSPISGGEAHSLDYLAVIRGSVSISHRSEGDFPFSLYWLPTKVRAEASNNFDFQVGPYGQSLYMRLGNYSLLARPDSGYLVRNGNHVFRDALIYSTSSRRWPRRRAPKAVSEPGFREFCAPASALIELMTH